MFLSMVDFFFSLNSSSNFEQPHRIFKLLIEFSHSVVLLPGRKENKTVKNVLLLILINTIMMGGKEVRKRERENLQLRTFSCSSRTSKAWLSKSSSFSFLFAPNGIIMEITDKLREMEAQQCKKMEIFQLDAASPFSTWVHEIALKFSLAAFAGKFKFLFLCFFAAFKQFYVEIIKPVWRASPQSLVILLLITFAKCVTGIWREIAAWSSHFRRSVSWCYCVSSSTESDRAKNT